MPICRFVVAFLLAILSIIGSRANAQANVVENQTTYLYVDGTKGSDSNSGSAASPFKTVQAAINAANTLNRASVGSKVIINPGIYRESVNLSGSSLTTVPLTVEAATTGTAVISGSNVLTGWAQVTSTTYSASWTANLAACALPSGWSTGFAPILLRPEMIFVNGVALTQVLANADMVPGTFFADNATSTMYVYPAPSTDMATAVVESAIRPETLSASGRTNLVLRGLVFEHAADCLNDSSATISSSTNVLIDSIQTNWNNWGGLSINSSNQVTVKNSIGSYNGAVGMLGYRDQNILYSFNESDYNNWRGAQAAFYNWAMGGTKLFEMRSTTVQDHFAYNNQAEGLWFDTDNKNITINNATLSGNVAGALQIERNEGPILLENSHLCSSGQGVNVLTSTGVTIQNNTFYNNGGTNKYQAEIYIAGQAGGINITDWQTGQTYDLFTTGMVLTGNTFENAGSGQLVFGTYIGGTDWTSFATTLSASGNTWYDPNTATSFKVVNGKIENLAGWQSTVQTDYTSVWQQPATSPAAACAAPSASYSDFNVNVDNNSYTMTNATAVATVRVNSFGYGTVNLQVTGLPTGVTATLSQKSMVSGAATLTLNASSAAVAQTAPITVWASDSSRAHSVTFYVKVQPSTTTQTKPTIAWTAPAPIVYGTALSAAQLNATLSVAGSCAYSPAAGTVLAVGVRTLTATCTPTNTTAYATPAPATVSLTVNPAALTITASSAKVAFGTAIPAISPIYSAFVNGNTSASLTTAPTCTTAYTTTSAVGSSSATTCSGAAATNYSIGYINGAITVTSGSQTITFAPPASPVTYGVSPIALSATASSGLPVTFSGTAGICAVSGNTLTILGKGTCTVTASQAGNAGYPAAPTVARTVTVNPAALTITASSATVAFGAAVPAITPIYGAFVNGNTSASLTTAPTCTTAYTTTSAIGSSPSTTCSGAAATNYSIGYINGAITVVKRHGRR